MSKTSQSSSDAVSVPLCWDRRVVRGFRPRVCRVGPRNLWVAVDVSFIHCAYLAGDVQLPRHCAHMRIWPRQYSHCMLRDCCSKDYRVG